MELEAMLYVPEDKNEYQIEIFCKSESRQVAEIFKDDNGNLRIEFYNNPNGNEWDIGLKEFIDLLQKSYSELDI